MSRILVTGATGFLGKHVQEAFHPHAVIGGGEHDIFYVGSSDFNLTSSAEVCQLFGMFLPDVVVHMAASCGGILANKNSPARFLVDNLKMGINIFEEAREYGTVKRIYPLGTVCAYPKYCPVPFQEDDMFNGFPEETNAPYAIAKRAQFMMSKTYREQYGIGGAFLVPVNLFGTHDHFDLTNSHVIPALIRKFTDAVKTKSDTVYCWGTGSATREFLYAGDCAEAIVKAVITELDYPEPINIGTGKDISIKELAELIADLTGFCGKIEFTGEVSDGQPKRRLDVSRAKKVLGFEAKTSLKEGLIKTIEWYKENA